MRYACTVLHVHGRIEPSTRWFLRSRVVCSERQQMAEMNEFVQSGSASPEPEEVGKTVLVSVGERSRPVSYAGGLSELCNATKAAFKDILGSRTDPSALFFQLCDDQWGGLFVDVLDETDVPDRAVLKAVETRSEPVKFVLLK